MDSNPSDTSDEVEKLYEYGERLNEAKEKAQHLKDYEGILLAVKGQSSKAKQLAAQLIPRFIKFFPSLSYDALVAQMDLIEFGDIGIRVQAIRGLPLICKDKPEYVSKVADILVQLLEFENVERDAVHKALITILRQDAKASLTTLFQYIETNDIIREKAIHFLKDKVFPIKGELLKPQTEMERHATDLVKKSLQDVTGAEFKLFMDFLKTLSIFGESAPPERIQELVEIIEGQADLDSQFNVTDVDHIDRLISCMYMALPFFMKGASSSKFINYFSKHIVPVFDEFPEERKLDLLKTLAGSSPYATAQDSRQLLPSIVQLVKKYMPRRKTEDLNFNYVECLLYSFHHLAYKTPNSTNSLCGYKIVTGQPSDRLGEDFSENYKEITERLSTTQELVKIALKKLNQVMTEHTKSFSAAKSNETKDSIKIEKQKTATGIHTCNNILALTQPLQSKSPSFIGDDKISLSWKEAAKPSPASSAGSKRVAASTTSDGAGTNATAAKKGRGCGVVRNQLMNRAFEGLVRGGNGGGGRSSTRGGRGWRGRGRGRGY